MFEMQNVTCATPSDSPGHTRARLERLLRRQRLLAWSLSVVTVIMTTSFFALLSVDAPLLRHVVYGRAVTTADAAAVTIILVMLLSVASFGWHAQRIDALRGPGERG